MPSDSRAVPLSRRGPLFWTSLLSLLALQALAFWLLCSYQVRRYEARRAAVDVQMMAFNDCLQYVQGSTIGSCTSRLGRQRGAPMSDAAQAPVAQAAEAQLANPRASGASLSIAGR
ncbi:MAG TPA: hypothetical protein VLJ86_01590 [Ramlibacter sp.]|nr:hypothetical protein [Ramlibacter sp.]